MTDHSNDPHRIRALWQRAETIHAVTYFAPESIEAAANAGARRLVPTIEDAAGHNDHMPGLTPVCASSPTGESSPPADGSTTP